jgi:hypothetical protein
MIFSLFIPRKARFVLIAMFTFATGTSFAQGVYQSFRESGFGVRCGCELRVNRTFISLAKQQGQSNIVGAYVCAENEPDPETGVLYNVNIYDEGEGYAKVSPSYHAFFEEKYLEAYANNLKRDGISYSFTTYQDVTAVEYTFDQMGLPTKAIVFLKNKKSYLLQVGARRNLSQKFNAFKAGFVLL